VFTGVAGSPAYSNFYFDDNGVTAGVYQTSVLGMWDTIKTAIRSGVTVTMVNPIPIIEVASGQVVNVVSGDGGTTAGTDTGQELPPFTSGLVRMHTGVFASGREVRGRCYVPYPSENANDAGTPGSGYISGLTAAFVTLQGDNEANGAMVVYSRAHARAEYISSFDTWNQWGSLRSRRD
jgi:hypothetical protein